MKSHHVCLFPLALGMSCLAHVSLAATQDTSADAKSGLEEVIVTARKTEESVQDVPVSVKAFSGADLEQHAVLSVSDLRNSVPGLFVAANSQGGAPTFAIRAAKADNGTSDTVTAYVGDVPVASTRAIANMMYDMQSISVLKGPQGTLFGANSTGGAIIFRPNAPSDSFEGYVDVGVGNYQRKSLQGMVNLPLNDMFQLRIAAEGVDRSKGFYKNTTATPIAGVPGSGYNGTRNLGTDQHESARVILRFKPTESLQNDLQFDYFHQDDQLAQQDYLDTLRGPYSYRTFLGFPLLVNFGAAGITPSSGDSVRLNADPVWNKANIRSYIDTATYEINDSTSLKAVLGYQNLNLDTSQQNGGGPNVAVNGRTQHLIEKWTFEPALDWRSASGRLRSKTGLFFSQTETETGNAYRYLGLPWDQTAPQNNFLVSGIPAWQFAGQFYPAGAANVFYRDFESHAIYQQIAYDVTPQLTASLGVRYTRDKGSYKATPHSVLPGAAGSAQRALWDASYGSFSVGTCNQNNIRYYPGYDPVGCVGRADYESEAPSFTLTLENRIDERSMIYATVRSGYLLGGFNNNAQPPLTGMPITFDPEKVVDFELGLKSDWELLGRSIRTNLAGFYGNYKDQQRVQNGTTPAGNTFTGVINAGASSFYGFDFDSVYEVSDNLQLSVSWSHIESEYTKFDAIVSVPGVYAFVDLSGQPMSQTPEDQVTLGATFAWPLAPAIGSLQSTLSFNWVGETTARDSPTFACTPNAAGECFGPASPDTDFRRYDVLKSHELWNFTTAWKGVMGSKIDANLWIKNVFDDRFDLYNSNQMLQFGYVTTIRSEPRTYGLNLRYSF